MENRSKWKEVFIMFFYIKENGQPKKTEASTSWFKENCIYIFPYLFLHSLYNLFFKVKGKNSLCFGLDKEEKEFSRNILTWSTLSISRLLVKSAVLYSTITLLISQSHNYL